MDKSEVKRVIIIGGGFAGLSAAKALAHSSTHGTRVHVTLIDRRNYHLFQPLLYQVATAALSPADIAVPIRGILSGAKNTHVLLGNVETVDRVAKTVTLTTGAKLEFDTLIMACGAKHSYFANPEWEEFAPGLKTLEQATEIRRRVLSAFENAESTTDRERHKEYMTFAVVGGGPTGVELAGALAEISRTTLSKDFRKIDPRRTRVILIEAGPRILATFDSALSDAAARDLEALGVQIWTNSRVTGMAGQGNGGEGVVELSLKGESVRAGTILWAAGVQPSSLGKSLGAPLDAVGRVIVTDELHLKGNPHVYVLGDQASVQNLPGLAPVAIQQGIHAAKNILRALDSKPLLPFHYKDKGQMATIGRKKAILQWKNIKLGGFFGSFLAWIAWLFIHIWYLIGFKNKLLVFMQWAWSYFTFGRGARLILHKDWRLK